MVFLGGWIDDVVPWVKGSRELQRQNLQCPSETGLKSHDFVGVATMTNVVSWGKIELTRDGALDTDEKEDTILGPEEEVEVPGR